MPSVDSSDDECCCVESRLDSEVWEPGMGLFLRLSSLRGWLGLGVRTLSLGQGDRGIPLSSLKETWTDFTLVEQCLFSVNGRRQLVNCLLKWLSETLYCNLFHCLTYQFCDHFQRYFSLMFTELVVMTMTDGFFCSCATFDGTGSRLIWNQNKLYVNQGHIFLWSVFIIGFHAAKIKVQLYLFICEDANSVLMHFCMKYFDLFYLP